MPREGHKFSSWSIRSLSTHFNPHAPRGARQRDVDFGVIPKTFQSTCPARGTTKGLLPQTETTSHFNPRAPRGARLVIYGCILCRAGISIHVPREGHDQQGVHRRSYIQRFQSTCPARGTTSFSPLVATSRSGFQSTCPARGTTGTAPTEGGATTYFNPRAPRGARPRSRHSHAVRGVISIHVPREGHDKGDGDIQRARRAISIHVPREGHDYFWLWDAYLRHISIHVPREGHDLSAPPLVCRLRHFNPRAPRGARRRRHHTRLRRIDISIHVPREGHDS